MQHLDVNFGGIWRFELGFFICFRFLLKKYAMIFSERELTLYVVVRPSVSLSVCLSVVCLSVTFVHPTYAIEIIENVSTPFGTLAISDLWVKF